MTMPKEAVEIAGGPGAVPVKPWGKVKNWYRFAALVLLNGVLLFLLLNLLLYLALPKPPRFAVDPFERYGDDKLLKVYPGWRKEDIRSLLTESWHNVKLEYEPFTGFREVPYRGKFVNIDPAGFRLSKDQVPWPPRPEATNVFLFGGSTTFGYGVPDDETIASYLGECGLANGSRGRLAVYNFGRTFYFSSQELMLFQRLLNAGFVPQVAVFVDGLNDFESPDGQPAFAGRVRRFMAGQPDSSPLDGVPMVRAAHWLNTHWTKARPRNATDNADRAVLDGIIGRWLANKRMIELTADAFGVRTIFVWQPVPDYKYDLRYHVFLSGSYYNESVLGKWPRNHYGYALMENLRAQGKLGGNVLWLADMQQDKHENLYVDGVHYNATFCKEIAAQICGFLNQRPNAK